MNHKYLKQEIRTCKVCEGTGKITVEVNTCKHAWAWWRNEKADCDFYLCERCGQEDHRYDCYCGAMGNDRKEMMSASKLKGRGYPEVMRDERLTKTDAVV